MNTREHVNVTCRVPPIGEAAALLLRLGCKPRLHQATMRDAANFVVASQNQKFMAGLHREMEAMSWAFVHDRPVQTPGRARERETISLLVSL